MQNIMLNIILYIYIYKYNYYEHIDNLFMSI